MFTYPPILMWSIIASQVCLQTSLVVVFWSIHHFVAHSSFFRSMERSIRPYHHDRYADCPAVVHLRFSQGLLPHATPTSTRDARELEAQTGSQGKLTLSNHLNQNSFASE